jgi:septal ring factor EnvC (AmiA/AmiB activator)
MNWELTMTAIREVLSQSEADFSTEMKEKGEALDKTNAALKESGSSLAEEKRKLEEARSKVREKEELEQKINNLRQAVTKLRAELQQSESGASLQSDIPVGEADKGLDLGGQLAVVAQVFPEELGDFSNVAFNQDQVNLLTCLERVEVLSGRSQVYQQHNQELEQMCKALKARSGELEERYKKIVSLCTGANEDQVDVILDNLVQAVISEQKDNNLELGKVRNFLRMVQGST